MTLEKRLVVASSIAQEVNPSSRTVGMLPPVYIDKYIKSQDPANTLTML